MKPEQMIATTQDRLATWEEVRRATSSDAGSRSGALLYQGDITARSIPTSEASSGIPPRNLSFSPF